MPSSLLTETSEIFLDSAISNKILSNAKDVQLETIFAVPLFSDRGEIDLVHLNECLESLAAQTDDRFAVVLINDNGPCFDPLSDKYIPGHKRALNQMIAKFESQMNIVGVTPDRNVGLGHARNIAILAAEVVGSKTVSLLDHDDRADPRRVEVIAREFQDPTVGVIYSNCRVIGQESEAVEPKDIDPDIQLFIDLLTEFGPTGFDMWKPIYMTYRYLTLPSTMTVRTELAAKYPFDGTRVCEDNITFMKWLADNYQLKFIPELIADYRVIVEGKSSASRERFGSFFTVGEGWGELMGLVGACDVSENIGRTTLEDRVIVLAKFLEDAVACRQDGLEHIAQLFVDISKGKTDVFDINNLTLMGFVDAVNHYAREMGRPEVGLPKSYINDIALGSVPITTAVIDSVAPHVTD